MTFCDKDELELKMKVRKDLSNAKNPLEKLRLQCMARGGTGIHGFSRQFRIIDDNGNMQLDHEEFKKGMHDFGVDLTDDELSQLFTILDSNGNGQLSFDEFLIALRPPLSESRTNIIKKAFQKMDKTGDGVLTAADMKGTYNVRLHPKYKNGEWSEQQVFENFLKTFEEGGVVDGKVTWDEFLSYYSSLSASIDNDCYFDLMMRNSFKI